ncbi:dTDP-4-dehydrorhamnose 3,5-epimerase [Alphaproteobacteria bacterium]|nr:dTDP-4-dehydrorhamnose 3,5-epimerase [Alphaproteobacteria bacterium]
MIKKAFATPLDIINTKGGNVMHAIKTSSYGYAGFGEAYFSQIKYGSIKGWKRHNKMTLNLVVPIGKIKFVLFDDREVSNPRFQEFILSIENYQRLTIPPKIWLAFQGLSENVSMLMNIADIPHNAVESEVLNINEINYDWCDLK